MFDSFNTCSVNKNINSAVLQQEMPVMHALLGSVYCGGLSSSLALLMKTFFVNINKKFVRFHDYNKYYTEFIENEVENRRRCTSESDIIGKCSGFY